jgi:Family of unknown function (DUF6428)
MNLSAFKQALSQVDELVVKLPTGKNVSTHFHITEVGQIDKKFIDCGGTIRHEQKVSFQLWESIDVWHRLEPAKLLHIIELSEEKVGVTDSEIEVEYQGDTIGKYGIEFENGHFQLTSLSTACLASDSCGIPLQKIPQKLSELTQKATQCCTPGGGCC